LVRPLFSIHRIKMGDSFAGFPLDLPCLPVGVGRQSLPKGGDRGFTLCGGFFREFPARENQNTWVALQGTSQNLRAFHSKTNSIILDCRNRSLGNACELGQLILASFLTVTNESHGLPN
jgi:hypothetical protein